MIGKGKDPRTILMGFAMVLLSLLALPALMKFFTWTTGAVEAAVGGRRVPGHDAERRGRDRRRARLGGRNRRRVGSRSGTPDVGAARPAGRSSPRMLGLRGSASAGADSGAACCRGVGRRRGLGARRPGRARHAREPALGAAERRAPRSGCRPRRASRVLGGRALAAAAAGPAGAAAAGLARGAAQAAAGQPRRRSRRDGGLRHAQEQAGRPRDYGGWRRRRGIGLWGLGTGGTFTVLVVVADADPGRRRRRDGRWCTWRRRCWSPARWAWPGSAASRSRSRALRRLRWWHASARGYTRYRATRRDRALRGVHPARRPGAGRAAVRRERLRRPVRDRLGPPHRDADRRPCGWSRPRPGWPTAPTRIAGWRTGAAGWPASATCRWCGG